MLSWRSPGDPQAGGAETVTHEILRRAVERGDQVTWFGEAFPGGAADEVIDGIRIVRRGRQWTVHLHAWRWLRSRLEEFDVVVDQINTLPFLTPFYVPQGQRRLLIHQLAKEYWWRQTRGIFRLLAPLGYLAEPFYLSAYRTTETITISESTQTDLMRIGIPRGRITVIPMAIDTPVCADLAEPGPPGRMIVVGRLSPAKFVEEAIEAFLLVRDRIPGAALDIVGSGDPEYREQLERRVADAGARDVVTFHGRIGEQRKTDLLDQAWLHIFASHREGWGLTVSEAAARGTPTVGYDAPGVRDSVRDPRLLAPIAEGPEGLANRIALLIDRPDRYAATRREAWERARELSWDRTADAFLEVIDD